MWCAPLAALTGAALWIPSEINRGFRLSRFATPFLVIAAVFVIAWLCQHWAVSRRAGRLAALGAAAAVLIVSLGFVLAACWVLLALGDYAIVVLFAAMDLVLPGVAAVPLLVLSAKLVRRVRVLLWPRTAVTR